MNLIKGPVVILLLFSFFITSSCANTKNVKKNTLIILGVAAGVALAIAIEGANSDSSDNNDPTADDGAAGGGGVGLIFWVLGGMLGGYLGYGIDLATTPKDKKE